VLVAVEPAARWTFEWLFRVPLLWRTGLTTVIRSRASQKRKLWSAVLGAALLALGFGRRRVEPGRVKQYDLPPRVRPAHRKARRAWFEIVRLLYSAIGEHRVVSIAAGVTFFSLLAIFPAIAALVSIYGIFADPPTYKLN
jgi:membrane protein